MKSNKSANFVTFLVKHLSYRSLKRPSIFSPLLEQRLLTIFECRRIGGVCCQNQKSRTTILLYFEHWPVTNLSILFQQIITPYPKLPGEVDFVCRPGLLFTELSRVTPKADAFSFLEEKTKYLDTLRGLSFSLGPKFTKSWPQQNCDHLPSLAKKIL